jgi:hypothetical protein
MARRVQTLQRSPSCARRSSHFRSGSAGSARNCTRLRDLDLYPVRSGSLRAGHAGPLALAAVASMHRLTNLTLAMHLTDASLDLIATSCSHLRSLELKRCCRLTDASIASIARQGVEIWYLRLGDCNLLTDAGLRELGRTGCMPKLEYLRIGGCGRFTDDGAISLISRQPRLVNVDVDGSRLTDVAVLHLASIARASGSACSWTLRTLQLGGCVGITDDSIVELASVSPSLGHLSLRGCCLITDSALFIVSTSCPTLHMLTLSNCINVTDAGINAVASGCRQLGYLDVTGCARLTTASIVSVCARTRLAHDDSIAIHLPHVENCPLVTETEASADAFMAAGAESEAMARLLSSRLVAAVRKSKRWPMEAMAASTDVEVKAECAVS